MGQFCSSEIVPFWYIGNEVYNYKQCLNIFHCKLIVTALLADSMCCLQLESSVFKIFI